MAENETKFYLKNRNGTREISRNEIRMQLKRTGNEDFEEMIVRDIEAGIPYRGADFIIANTRDDQ